MRLSTSSLAGTERTLVAVGTARLAVMLTAVRAAVPRSRAVLAAAAGAGAAGLAGWAAGGAGGAAAGARRAPSRPPGGRPRRGRGGGRRWRRGGGRLARLGGISRPLPGPGRAAAAVPAGGV